MNVVSQLRSIKTGTVAGLNFSQDEWKVSLAPILKLWSSLYRQLADNGVNLSMA